MKKEENIVFEDLDGNPDAIVEVDLEADEEPGIRRRSQETASEEDDAAPIADSKPAAKAGEKGGNDEVDERLRAAQEEARAAREELDRFRAQQADSERAASKEAVNRMVSEIEAVEAQLEEAIEAGDTKKQVRLTSQLTDLKARKLSVESRVEAEPVKPARNPKVEGWMRRNDWYNQPGKERYTRLTNRLDREVAAEGYDPKSDDYWVELDTRLKREAPELFAEDKPERKRSGDRVAPVSGDAGGTAKRSTDSRVRLERADFRVMRKFGLDPNNPKHVKEFARNKLEADREADERRQRA
jgi:hypothetical protein